MMPPPDAVEIMPVRRLGCGRRAAFTLPELLVCIVIVGVLAMLASHSISLARKASFGAKNAGNHRQIAAALIALATDREGNLPYAHEQQEVSATPPFVNQTSTYTRRLVALGYVTNPAIFFSPQVGTWWKESGNIQTVGTHKNDPWNYPNYGANRYGAMPFNRSDNDPKVYPVNLKRLGAEGVLSQMMLLRDVYEPDNAKFGGGELRLTRSNMPSPDRTYNGRVYASFTDGHVEAYNREELLALEAYSNSLTKNQGVAPIFYQKYTR